MSSEAGNDGATDLNAIQVCVRVRPLNSRELDEGHRVCVSFDDPSKQVVLTAVDKNTLLQLRGSTAKGYAFDKRYGQDTGAKDIYEDVVGQLVENCFKGYNGTVLAYGQTGSGKTHTMSGGVGIHGVVEEGLIPRVINHVFAIAEQLRKRAKTGDKTEISAYALELYNEDLRDLAFIDKEGPKGWDGVKSQSSSLKLQERPIGKDGRVVPEVVGVTEMEMHSAADLMHFFETCVGNRSTSSTKLNDRSSRSHAIFTIIIKRTFMEVMNELGEDMRAKVRTSEFQSKLHLVDLAGSERVKRSGVTGKELKEATHINSGLLALGNVIVALADEGEGKKKRHIPYKDSKLTRLLQDSLGGNSLTLLISCISPSESDFEETNNTLKYANRACSIKNTPLPNKFTLLEEDLLPVLPSAGGSVLGLVQLQALLEEHGKMKEYREKKDREKKEKDAKRNAALAEMRDKESKTPGFQRLRATTYDELRRQLAQGGGKNIPASQLIGDEMLGGFGRPRRTQDNPGPATPGVPSYMRNSRGGSLRRSAGSGEGTPTATPRNKGHGGRSGAVAKSAGNSFGAWLATQNADGGSDSQNAVDPEALAELDDNGTETYESEDYYEGDNQSFIDEDAFIDDGIVDGEGEVAPPVSGIVEALPEPVTAAAGKSKFRRGGIKDEPQPSSADALVAEEEAPNSIIETMEEEYVPEEEVELDDLDIPKLLARFKVNQHDTLAVFKASTQEDFKDVIGLLPENTPLPASDKMTYLLARLEGANAKDMAGVLLRVSRGEMTMNEAVGPAVGCLMATFGTNMISSCIFQFVDPEDLSLYTVDERIELWGLQIPHNSVRPSLQVSKEAEATEEGAAPAPAEEREKDVITWSSVDRLNMSIGLLYALCNHALENDVRCGFCVPRPQLLRRWLQAGVKMKQVEPASALKLIYPPSAHDYEYYKASTVAYFMVAEVKEALEKVLGIVRGSL